MKTTRNPIELAIRIAAEQHAGQKDKAGACYIMHPLRLMMRMNTDTARIAAVLHDVVEDSSITLDDLREAGIPSEAVRVVDLLTRRPGQGKEAYYRRLGSDGVARAIKLADLEDNMDVRRLRRVTPRDCRRMSRYRYWWGRLASLERAAGRRG